MMAYVGIKLLGLALDHNWHLLATGWGLWFLFELLGWCWCRPDVCRGHPGPQPETDPLGGGAGPFWGWCSTA
jgi:hypothetical protein